MEQHNLNKITLEELKEKELQNDLIIIRNGAMKHLALPDYGQVTLKIHQEAVTNVVIEKQIKP